MCSLQVTFKGKHSIWKFYVVEHAILGVVDSKKRGLIKVNFDAINPAKMVRLVHSVDNASNEFKTKIESGI